MTTAPLRADQVEAQNIEWLWRERIPKAMFTMIAGRPDQRKSMMATLIAAELTREGKRVLYSSKEREPGVVEKPRFLAAGGVEKRMFYWRFSLPRQTDELVEYITENKIDLVVMDPVAAHFIGVSKRSDRIREVTNPLTEIAEQTGCAFLFIEHALKRVSPHADPLSAIEGHSSGIPAACSMVFICGNKPGDADHTILANVKSNIAERRLALDFEIDTVDVAGIEDQVPTLVFREEVQCDPMSLLVRDGTGGVGRPNRQLQDAAKWLTNYLAAADGPVLSKVIQEDAKQYEITNRTLRRAAKSIGVIRAGGGQKTTWALSEDGRAALKATEAMVAPKPELPETAPAWWSRKRRTLAVLAYIDAILGPEPVKVNIPKAEQTDADVSFSDEEFNRFLEGLQ